VARPAKLTASRIRTEEMLLGALLRRAERGRWPPATLDLQPHELRSEHAAATFYEVTRLWRDFDPDPVPRHEIIGALVDKHGAKRSEADAYLRRIRADVPSQEYIREYVRRIKADNVRQAEETGPPTAGA
jgi:replicative DNA helicase